MLPITLPSSSPAPLVAVPLTRQLASAFLLACLAAACKSPSSMKPGPEASPAVDPRASAPASAAEAPVPADRCALETRALRYPQKGRLVAIGDVHGDAAATRRALRVAGAIDESDTWIGGTLVVVQTGDILDRGDEEQEILELFERLSAQAEAAGGKIHRLNGNHELMNAMGDFRYVTPGGFADFVEGELPEPLTAEPRARAFLPGGPYASKLADFDIVRVVGDSVFVHGGVLPRFVDDLAKANRDARCFLLGEHKEPPEAVLDPEGPLWTRAFSTGDSSCEILEQSLEKLGVSRMVVGHTPQLEGITSACEGRVWRIDTGMASFYQGPTEVLEIQPEGRVQVLR